VPSSPRRGTRAHSALPGHPAPPCRRRLLRAPPARVVLAATSHASPPQAAAAPASPPPPPLEVTAISELREEVDIEEKFAPVPEYLVEEFHLTTYQGRRVLGSSPAIRQAPVHLPPSLYYKILSLICCIG
jgi:hypothetical protein